MSVELAVFIESPGDLDSLSPGTRRIYCGSEFCERLLPSSDELRAVVDRAAEASIATTLVTPYVIDEELAVVKQLLQVFHEVSPSGEVVFSDWGVLWVLREEFPSLTPVLGRLLNKQTIDPRIESVMESSPASARSHFQAAAADNPVVEAYLKDRGVNRIEFDNTCQGFIRQGTLPASLHVPYVLFSVTRLCPAANWGAGRGFRGIGSCRKECLRHQWEVAFNGIWKSQNGIRKNPNGIRKSPNGIQEKVLSYGRAQLMANYDYPPDPASLGIDRIVNHVGIA